MPQEFIDFLLMREFKWTWAELRATPAYVLRYCYDMLQLIYEHENDEAEKSRRRH